MTRVVPILDRTAERKARIVGDAVPALDRPGNAEPVPSAPANDARRSKPSFTALESLSGYWRGRASGRQSAVDFYRGEACQRETTAGVDVSHDLLRDHQAVADYERRAELAKGAVQ